MKCFRHISFSFLALLMAVSFLTPGCAGKKKSKKKQEQLAALRGEDIPLSSELEDWQFVEPNDPLVFDDVYFEYNSSIIRENARPQLARIADWLKDRRNVAIMIEGHTDERGSKEYNLSLGEQRALSVRRYLTGLGVDADRIYTVSYGEEKPKNDAHDETAWAENRRAHFLVTR